jgi:ABC-2 type transport system permease protein
MRKIAALARNVLLNELSERSSWLFYLVLPILFTVVIGLGLGGGRQVENLDNRIRIAVIDHDQTDLSSVLINILNSSQVVRLAELSESSARLQVEEGDLALVVIVPAGYEEDLLAGLPVDLEIDQTGTTTANAARQAVSAAASQAGAAVNAARTAVLEREKLAGFPSPAEKIAYFRTSLEQAEMVLANPPAAIESSSSNVSTILSADGFRQSSPGNVVTWTLITLLAASEAFVSERLSGTLRRLIITPSSKAILLAGKLIGWFILGMLQIAILIGFGWAFLGVNWGRSPWALVMVAAAFSLAAVSLGILLSTVARTRSQAGSMITLFGMVLSALGGAWWPLEITPPAYQAAVKVLPTTWAMQGFHDVILRGLGPVDVLLETGVLLGFAAILFSIAILRFKYE